MSRIGMDETIKCADWLRANAGKMPDTIAKVKESLKAGTGLDITPQQIRRIAEGVNVVLPGRKARNGNSTRNINDAFHRDSILAKSIRELAQAQGHELSTLPLLNQIIARRTPDQPQQQELYQGQGEGQANG